MPSHPKSTTAQAGHKTHHVTRRRPGHARQAAHKAPAPDRRGRHDRRLPESPGAYWGHAPDHRDNRRRDPRHIACLHGCRQDRRNAQDISHHRADRDSRHHHRVARGQAPSSRLARRSRRGHPHAGRCAPVLGRATDSGRQAGQPAAQPVIRDDQRAAMSMATKYTHPAVMADSVPLSGAARPWRRSSRSSASPPATSRATTRPAGTTVRSPAGSARHGAC